MHFVLSHTLLTACIARCKGCLKVDGLCMREAAGRAAHDACGACSGTRYLRQRVEGVVFSHAAQHGGQHVLQ